MRLIVAPLAALLVACPAVAAEPKTPPPAAPATVTSDPNASPCSGALTGAVAADFGCTVQVVQKGSTVEFVVTPTGNVKGLKRFAPLVFALQGPVVVQTYAHRDLVMASAGVETAAGKKFRASERLGDRGDLEVQVRTMELTLGRYPLSQMHVHAHLVPADAKDRSEIQLDVDLETTW